MSTSPSRASASGAPQIPEFMPILSAGAHSSPADGACIMEYASFLAGEKWTDTPYCTNILLAYMAQGVNDELGDDRRQELLPLLPRLMGTGPHVAPMHVEQAIAEAAVDYVAHLKGHPAFVVADWAKDAAISLRARSLMGAVDAARIAVQRTGGDTVDFLSHLIDAYDKATGRTEAATVTEDDLRRCAELTGAAR